jgi:glyoxylase-like metal-dependent hydrolase (beta-lactamase superfamily II)
VNSISFRQDFGGIHRIEPRSQLESGAGNIYLVPQESGWIVVDCRMDPTGYESTEIKWAKIRQIVLTHFHVGYTGFLTGIRRFTDAPIRMPLRPDDLLNRLRATVHCLSWHERLLHWAGLLDPTRVRAAHAASSPLAGGSYIEDGEIIPTALGSMQSLLTPGHSHGHLSFYFAKRRLLLAGDPLSRRCDEGSALADCRTSLRQLQVLNVTGCCLRTDGPAPHPSTALSLFSTAAARWPIASDVYQPGAMNPFTG